MGGVERVEGLGGRVEELKASPLQSVYAGRFNMIIWVVSKAWWIHFGISWANY